MKSELLARVIAMPDTPEWYAARALSIGASEAAAVCGLSRYETPMSVYLRKTGQLPEKEENAAMRMGKRLEQAIREEWSMLTHTEVEYPIPMVSHQEYGCITATPDGLISETEGLECKSTNGYAALSLGAEGTDAIHPEWIIQAQQQMAVFDLMRVHYAVLVDGRDMRTYVVNRNEKLIDLIVRMNLQMWDRIATLTPPDWDFESPSTPEEIRALFTEINGNSVVLSADAEEAWIAYRDLGASIKLLEAKRDAAKACVLAEIGNATSGILDSLGIEIVRTEIAGGHVAYDRAPYISTRERKLIHVKRNRRPA